MAGDVLPLVNDFLEMLAATSNGAADGSSAIASNAGQVDDFYVGDTLRILAAAAQSYVNEEREIIGYTAATGTFLVDPPFTSQIVAGDVFGVILGRPVLGGSSGPFIAVSGIADAGSTNLILVDAARTEPNNYWNGSLLIMLSGANKGQGRQVKLSVLATTELDVLSAFDAAIVAGDRYIVVSFSHLAAPANDTGTTLFEQVLGNKTDVATLVVGTVYSVIAYLKGIMALLGGGGGVVVDGSVGPSNFFAGAITVLSLTPADVSYLDSFDLDCNGFTNGAILTATIIKRVGAGNLQRQEQIQFTKDANNNWFPIISGPMPLKATATSLVITVQSSDIVDIAVTTPFSYVMR